MKATIIGQVKPDLENNAADMERHSGEKVSGWIKGVRRSIKECG
ncbi:hypothetical protein [Escherichia coli]